MPEAEGKPHFTSPWFVFNDFVVHNISEQEALSFSGKWKVSALRFPSTPIPESMFTAGSHYHLPGTDKRQRCHGFLKAARRYRYFNSKQ